jgi:hypothetical protein
MAIRILMRAAGAAAAIGLTALCGTASAATYVFTTLNDPSATLGTFAYGVNKAGAVVGYYQDGAGMHGYVYSGGVYTDVVDPAALPNTTIVTGINSAGEMVGDFQDAKGLHAFIDNGGVFTTIDDPSGVNATAASGINDYGALVGLYESPGPFGYMDVGGVFSTLTDPLATGQTVAEGLNNAGEVVGFYSVGGVPHGFTYDAGTYSTLNEPLGPLGNNIYSVNNAGDLAGVYVTANGTHGFTDVGGVFSTLNDPMGKIGTTFAFGINDSGLVSGIYRDADNMDHGFIATPSAVPEPATWAMLLLGLAGAGALLRNRRRSAASILI